MFVVCSYSSEPQALRRGRHRRGSGERQRLKIIPNGFGEKPVLKLMFGALIRAGGLRFTEFELPQSAAVVSSKSAP